ncbi:hypothetical protein [Pectobacterium polaris]|uniref:hypothetical protein n=1 Tax=Pectobacterium polaris TaxID=2042057 RepID=UPI0020319DB4|nr:hypothetical protein [Pectobacterium polaris]MCL6359356.1 hypothetical protein [Pectobacterium polaris]
MTSSTYFEIEHYECNCTNGPTEESIENSCLCTDCNEHIRIYAEESGERCVFIRKMAKDIVNGDLVWLENQKINEYHEVLGVNTLNSKADVGKLGLGLKGYGQKKVTPEDIIICRIGAW